MACPQKENGYTGIANEILERIIASGLNGTEIAIILHILRKTYGYQKKEDEISFSQFLKVIPITRPTLSKALHNLQLVNIIKLVKKGSSKICSNLWLFNKDYETWQLVKKYKLVKKKNATSKGLHSPTSKETLTNKRNITKENTKETIAETSSAIPDLLKDKQKHIQIIGLWARAKKITFTSIEHQRSYIKRNLRPAQDLSPYPIQKIIDTMDWLINNADFKTTLESVGKFIDEDLKDLTIKKQKDPDAWVKEYLK